MKYIGSSKQPTALYCIALTEICRRIAFGSIAYLFFLYIADFQHFTEHASGQIGAVFTLITLFLPVLGGFVVERIQYRLSVIWGVLLNVIGCFLILTNSLPFLFIALVLVAFGNALFLPGSYALLGTFYQQRPHLRDSGFSIYYALVSLGPLAAFWVLNGLADLKNVNGAFFVAGSIGLLGLIPLSIALKQYNRLKLQAEENAFSPLHKQEKDRIWVVSILIVFSLVFWIAQDLAHSTLNPLILEHTPSIIKEILPADMRLYCMQSIYLIIIALVLAKIYLFSYKKRYYSNAVLKISLAFFILSICFAMLNLDNLELHFGSFATNSVFTIYAFFILAELLLAPIGLSLITRLSPRRYTAVLIGIWITGFNAAFYLKDLVFVFIPIPTLHTLFETAAIALITAGLLIFALSKKLNRMCHFELF